MSNHYVRRITLAPNVKKKVAYAEIEVGQLTIRRLSVWQSPNGRLRVFVPSQPLGRTFENIVDIPADTLAEIETEVIAAYRAEKEEAEHRMATRTKM